jgi:hypothetical protein
MCSGGICADQQSSDAGIITQQDFAILHHIACVHGRLRLGETQSVHQALLPLIRAPLHSGARVALCELPFSLVQTDTEGGLGGTCILRGCVPKKLLVYGGEFANEFKECEGYGYAYCIMTCCTHSFSPCTAKNTVMHAAS